VAEPFRFAGFNRRLMPAKGTEHVVKPLYVYNDRRESISCWKLDPAETKRVLETGEVWVAVAAGDSSPPIFVSGQALMRAWDADTGEDTVYHADGSHVVTDARQFATLHHAGQTYGESLKPHTYHCAKVVQALTDFGADWLYLASGWLHDTEEDCWEDEPIEARRARVRERFGDAVESIVWACTGVMFIDGVKQNRKKRNEQQYAKIEAYPAAAPTKGADRIANMEECVLDRSSFGFMYVDEVLEFDARVGVHCPPAMRVRYLTAALTIYEWDVDGKIKTPRDLIAARLREIEDANPTAQAA
jgi:hypothetical protein